MRNGVRTLPWYGASYKVSWSANRRSSVGTSSTFNPNYGSTFNFSFSQPLWRGFSVDGNRLNVESTQRRRAITDIALEQNVVTLDANVRLAYLQLVAAIQGLKVAEQNLQTEETALENTRARVKVGVAPDIEIISYQAQVASRQVQKIAAEANIEAAEDTLRRLIMDPARPTTGRSGSCRPTRSSSRLARSTSIRRCRTPLQNRLDLIAARREMELTDVQHAAEP